MRFWRPQFGLRMIFWLMVMSAFGWTYYRDVSVDWARERIVKLGGFITPARMNSDLLDAAHQSGQLVEVKFPDGLNGDLPPLHRLSNLGVLIARKRVWSEADARVLSQCAQLRAIHADNGVNSRNLLRGTQHLPWLRVLDLAGADVTDGDLELINGGLETVTFGDSGPILTDRAFAYLGGISNLNTLYLHGRCDITDAGLGELARCPKLHSLQIGPAPKLTDWSFEVILSLPQLFFLMVESPNFTNTGLLRLRSRESISGFYVLGDNLTPAGFNELNRQMKLFDDERTRREHDRKYDFEPPWIRERRPEPHLIGAGHVVSPGSWGETSDRQPLVSLLPIEWRQ